MRHRKFLFGFLLILFLVGGAVSVSRVIKIVRAADISVSVFTADDYDTSAEDVTYDLTFVAPVDEDEYYQFGLMRVRGDHSTVGADFANATLVTLTDDGADISGNVSLSKHSPDETGYVSGFTLLFSGGLTIEGGSTVVASFGGITNPVGEGAFIPSISGSDWSETNQGSAPSQAFGTPLVKFKVTDPEGTVVSNANIWIGSLSTMNYFNAGGETDAGGQTFFFISDFYGVDDADRSGDYSVEINPPSDSEYTRPPNFTITLAEGETLDCTNKGSTCSEDVGNGPILLTRPMAKGKVVVPANPPSTVTALAGSGVANVQVQVRDSVSMDPGASNWMWTDSEGNFRIGGLSAGTYTIEFAMGWGNEQFVGLLAPDTITNFVVNANGSVTYNSSTTAAASLPRDFGNLALQVANKDILGKVVDGDGNGINGMRIRANKMMGMGDSQTTTAANGTYGLQVGAGNWWIMPEIDYSNNYDDDTTNDVSANYIYCGMPKNVVFEEANSVEESSTGNNFTMKQATATITGRVVLPNGSPVTGNAGVNAFSKGGCGGYSSVDWDDGTFSVSVPPGTYNIQVNSWNEEYGDPATETVTVTTGTTNLGDFSLVAKEARISGRLWADANNNDTYDAGEGVGNTRVEAFKMARKFDEFSMGGMGGPMGGSDWATTNSSNDAATKGQFTLYVTQGSWNVNVMADMGMMHGGYSTTATNYIYTGSPIQVNITSATGTSTGNNFELKVADATINGRLWNDINEDGEFDNGEGVPGVFGYAFAEPDGAFNQGPMMGMGMGAGINNGSFTIKVPAGTYRVGVDFPPDMAGYTPSAMATVTVAESGTATVNVPVIENNAIVAMCFKDVDGNAVTSLQYAETFLNNSAGAHQWQMFSTENLTTGCANITTAAGEWYIGYHIDPTTDNYMSEPMSDNKVTAIADDTVTKNITLRVADSTVSGTVYDPSGSPLAGVFISTDNRKAAGFDMAGPMFMRGEVTENDGAYSLTLPAGTYKVEARFPPSAVVGGQTVTYLNPDGQEVTISADSPVTANFTFQESDATITGTVTLDGNDQGAFISAYSDVSGYNETITTNGSYTLNVTKDDTWYLRAMYETGNDFYQSDIHEVAMGGNTTQSQDLAMSVVSFTIPDPVSTTFNCANAKQVTLSNGASLSIPASAIVPASVDSCDSTDSGSNITLNINPTAQMSLQDQSIPIGVGYEISASDSNGSTISDTFNSNVTLTIPYTDEEIEAAIGGTIDEELLGNGYWDTSTSAWRSVDSQVLDADNDTLTISTNHFTLFGVLAATDASTTGGDSGDDSVSSGAAAGTTASGGVSKPMAPKNTGSIVEGAVNRVTLMIPSGALKWDGDFEINKLESGFNKPRPPLWIASGPYKVVMKSWWNGAEFSDFKKPVILIVRYDPTALGEIPESSLRLNYYDSVKGYWRPISSLLIKDRHEVAAVIDQIHGTYALIGGFGYQGAPAYTGTTVTAEAGSEEIGITEELLPTEEIKEETKHPTAVSEPVEQEPAPKESWLRRLLKKIFPFLR